jgi:hypothetical protein
MKVDRNSRPDDDALTDALSSMFFKRLTRMKVKKFVKDLHAVAPREPVLVLPPGAQYTSTSGQQFEAPFAESLDISSFLEAEASFVPGAQGPPPSGQQFEAPFAESLDISSFLEAEASFVPGAQGPPPSGLRRDNRDLNTFASSSNTQSDQAASAGDLPGEEEYFPLQNQVTPHTYTRHVGGTTRRVSGISESSGGSTQGRMVLDTELPSRSSHKSRKWGRHPDSCYRCHEKDLFCSTAPGPYPGEYGDLSKMCNACKWSSPKGCMSQAEGQRRANEVRRTDLSSSSRGVGAAGCEAAFDLMPSAQYYQRPLPQQP